MYYDQYLVIDYGTTHIKGILYRQVLGSVTILRHETLQIVSLDDNRADEYEYNIVRFMQSFFPEETNFLINIPMENVFIRDLAVPFNTEKAIKEIIPFEVENLIPFPIDDMGVMGRIWRLGKEVSNVITFSAHHVEIERVVKPFIREDVSLSCISADAPCLSAAIQYHQTRSITDSIVAQIDIGGKICNFTMNQDGLIRHARYFTSGGGHYLTEKIARLLESDYNRAEEVKQAFNFSFDLIEEEFKVEFLRMNSITDTQFRAIIKLIHECFDSIQNEIEKSIYSLASDARPAVLYLSGGGSQFKDMDSYLSDKLGIPVKRYNFLELPDPSFTTALGMGYHYRLKKSDRIDFLTPEFAKRIKNSLKLEVFKPHLIIAAISFVILVTVFFVQITIDNKAIAANERELRKKFKEGFGYDAPEDVDAIDEAVKKVKEENKRSEIVRLFLNKENILELLLDLNQNFPGKENFDFILDQFTLDGAFIMIYGRVNEFSDIGTIQTSLEKSQKFKNIKILNKNLITGVNKLKVRFKIELEIVEITEKKINKDEDNAE